MYAQRAASELWNVLTLQRNIGRKIEALSADFHKDKLEFVKNLAVAKFLGYAQNNDFSQLNLEKSIIKNLEDFFLHLEKGYSLVAQKQDNSIDLVFYNSILKYFIVINLKTSKITYQDIEQMNINIRMYDKLK